MNPKLSLTVSSTEMGLRTILSVIFLVFGDTEAAKPNFLIFMVDDFGYNDVSWNNPTVYTPHLDALGREGIILDTYYTAPRCSPSRASFLTGLYPHRIGIQRGNVSPFRPTGLATKFKLLPQYLQEAGYSTHLVGKWHLGYCHPDYLPTRRGFQTFFGQWGQQSDQFTRMHESNDYIGAGYDLRRGENITYEGENEYGTHLWRDETIRLVSELRRASSEAPWLIQVSFTAARSPYQAPEAYIEKYANLSYDLLSQEDKVRYGMISAVDAAVGDIVKSLEDLRNNTVIIFTSDNGSEKQIGNIPFRGVQGTLWEGALRVPAFINSDLLKPHSGRVVKSLVHISDWMPTILNLAGININSVQSDGFDIWDALKGTKKFKRKSVVYSLDKDDKSRKFQFGVRINKFKFVWGDPGRFEVNSPFQDDVYHLYNLEADPGEYVNLASTLPRVVEKMKEKVLKLAMEIRTPFHPSRYSLAYPRYHQGIISTGWCEADWWKIIWNEEEDTPMEKDTPLQEEQDVHLQGEQDTPMEKDTLPKEEQHTHLQGEQDTLLKKEQDTPLEKE